MSEIGSTCGWWFCGVTTDFGDATLIDTVVALKTILIFAYDFFFFLAFFLLEELCSVLYVYAGFEKVKSLSMNFVSVSPLQGLVGNEVDRRPMNAKLILITVYSC